MYFQEESQAYNDLSRAIRAQMRHEAEYLARTVPTGSEAVKAREEIRAWVIGNAGRNREPVRGDTILYYITAHGKCYHKEFGCHGALIPCDEEKLPEWLDPCKDCCGSDKSGDDVSMVRKPFDSMTGEPQLYSLADCMDAIGRCWHGWEPMPQGIVNVSADENTIVLFPNENDMFGCLNNLNYYCTRPGYQCGSYAPERAGRTRVVMHRFHVLYGDGHVVTANRGDVLYDLFGDRWVLRVSGLLARLAAYGFVPDDLIEVNRAVRPVMRYWMGHEERRGNWEEEEETSRRRHWRWGNWHECRQMMEGLVSQMSKSRDIVCLVCELPPEEWVDARRTMRWLEGTPLMAPVYETLAKEECQLVIRPDVT